jgi:pteridine reductase
MELRGKTALVTGAAKRVGREIALAFARQGTAIALHYRSSSAEAERTAAEIRALGVGCRLLRADLDKTDETLRLAAEAGNVDILVNSASLFFKTPMDEPGESGWDALLNANLKAPYLLSRELGNRMRAGAGGVIVNIADWSGLKPYADYSAYCASKAGLIALTKSLARDLGPSVRANAVAPGPVLAPGDFPEKEKEAVAKKTALGRWGSPADVAHAAVFLAESDFINGTVLVVDGGRSLY